MVSKQSPPPPHTTLPDRYRRPLKGWRRCPHSQLRTFGRWSVLSSRRSLDRMYRRLLLSWSLDRLCRAGSFRRSSPWRKRQGRKRHMGSRSPDHRRSDQESKQYTWCHQWCGQDHRCCTLWHLPSCTSQMNTSHMLCWDRCPHPLDPQCTSCRPRPPQQRICQLRTPHMRAWFSNLCQRSLLHTGCTSSGPQKSARDRPYTRCKVSMDQNLGLHILQHTECTLSSQLLRKCRLGISE